MVRTLLNLGCRVESSLKSLVVAIMVGLIGVFGCSDKEARDLVLQNEIREVFGLESTEAVTDQVIRGIFSRDLSNGDSLTLVKEQIKNLGLENRDWWRSTWNAPRRVLTCEIVISSNRGVFVRQDCIGILFYFDERERLTKIEALPYQLR